MKKFMSWMMAILAIIMLLALLLHFDWAAEPVAKMFNTSVDTVKTIGKTVLWTAIGLYLISTGVAALSVPIIGIILIGVGLTLVVMGLYPLFSKNNTRPE